MRTGTALYRLLAGPITFSAFLCMLFFAGVSSAEVRSTVITADSLEYFPETKKYVATGSVIIEDADTHIEADAVTYDEVTSDVIATGNVRFDDPEKSIRASKAELNMDAKKGKLYEAVVFYRKEHYYLSGKEIEKRSDNAYFALEAAFTTCDGSLPAWCFRGREVDVQIGRKVISRDTSFLIKNVPVMYSPYLWTSLTRETGFLIPDVSSSKTRGFGVNLPFFWAIAEDRDATIYLDYYSKRGTGAGLEYRFLKPGGIRSNWWAYYLRDTELDKAFAEVKVLHENRFPDRLGGFLSIDYVNEKDFYREYSPHRELRIQRFLESTGELNLPFREDSRIYLLSQYRLDLKNDQDLVPQKLPEVGFVKNYTKKGSFMLSLSTDAANIRREDGTSVIRTDLYPKVLHSAGKDYVISQKAAFRDTLYYYDDDAARDDHLQRLAFEYDITGHTRLYRDYSSFTHVIEPSVRYHFISSSENELDVSDSVDLYRKTSLIEVSLLNRAIVKGWEVFALRITQPIDTYSGDRPFLPIHLEALMRTSLPLTMDLTYNVHTGDIETASADVGMNVLKTNILLGMRYNKKEEIMLYSAAADFSPFKSVNVAGQIWYDAKGDGLRDLSVVMRYVKQCWAMRVEAVKRPGDFSMKVVFELAGIGSSGKKFTDYSPSFF